MTAAPDAPAAGRATTRRGFLRAGGLAGAGLAVGGATGVAIGRGTASSVRTGTSTGGAAGGSTAPIPFHGARQAGITTPAPAQLRFTAYDLTTTTGSDAANRLRSVLMDLSATAASMMAGTWVPEQLDAAAGLPPGALTVTIAVGAGAVRVVGREVPAPLAALPAFAGERLDAARSDGDLAVQVCADDPFLAASAAQAITTRVEAWARVRWTQAGFLPGRPGGGASGSTSGATSAATLAATSAATSAATPRNLMGQLDGTDNPTGSRLELAVWATDQTTPWMLDGTYLVTRRIRMRLPQWRAMSVPAREAVIGRSLSSGAPLSGGAEHTVPDFTAVGAGGSPLIATDAHVRLTHPANNGGATMLRRGYSYDDGVRADGAPDAGLFFQCFQTDPHATFVPIQRKLATTDALSRFVVVETSAVFAVLPGAPSSGHWVGETMFG